MNKTKIEWTDYTWNPVTGCKRGCFYCYAKILHHRFQDFSFNEVKLHEDRLRQPLKLKKPFKIFVGSMTDLWADWTPYDFQIKVNKVFYWGKRHTFQLLTKSPRGYHHFNFPNNCWLGLTITGKEDNQSHLYCDLGYNHSNIRFISFEPLIDNPLPLVEDWQDWIIIGAMTGNTYKKKYAPKLEWIENILEQADKLKLPVFMKSNLKPYWKGKLRQEFPK